MSGATSGIGYELTQLLFSKNATVIVAARNVTKATATIEALRAGHPDSTGTLEPLSLDLADLVSVAKAAREVKSRWRHLDVLFNNAGVMHPPPGSVTAQGHELQLGVHNLGPLLLSEMLSPVLARAEAVRGGRGRVVWVGSLYAELGTPEGGFELENIDYKKKDKDTYFKYSVSKVGVYYQGAEYARRHKEEGITQV